MSYRKPILTMIAAAALGTAALPAAPAAASPVYVASASSGAPWPVWTLGLGVVSIMARAAYVYRTECRELTGAEAFGGMVGPWPLYHKARNHCGAKARGSAPVVGRY